MGMQAFRSGCRVQMQGLARIRARCDAPPGARGRGLVSYGSAGISLMMYDSMSGEESEEPGLVEGREGGW